MIFLKCKIRFIYVGFNCKRKKWGKKMSENLCHQGGGGRTPNGKCHLKFPFWLLAHLPKSFLVKIKKTVNKTNYFWLCTVRWLPTGGWLHNHYRMLLKLQLHLWRQHTQVWFLSYLTLSVKFALNGWHHSSCPVRWFWAVLSALKTSDKYLLSEIESSYLTCL